MSDTAIKHLDVKQAWRDIQANKDVKFIDVREMDEIEQVATTTAEVYPMSTLNPSNFAEQTGTRKSQPIYILCRSGGRSMRVASALANEGFSDLTNIEGGITAWVAAGLPTK